MSKVWSVGNAFQSDPVIKPAQHKWTKAVASSETDVTAGGRMSQRVKYGGTEDTENVR
jgi:hypothetical protein